MKTEQELVGLWMAMKLTATKMTVGTLVPICAALVAMWVNLDPWPAVGWETPNQHDADYAETIGEMKDFRDEWKCDEYDEELLDLLKAQRSGDDSVETEREIEKLRERMAKLECERFDDD